MSSLGQPEPAQSPPLPILTIISKAFNEIHGQLNTACRREIVREKLEKIKKIKKIKKNFF